MRFAAPEFLKALLLLLPLIGALIILHRQRAARLAKLISSKVWKTVIPGNNPKQNRRRTLLRTLALLFILLALARPQWGYKMEEVKQRGLDIIVVLDTSKSMLAADIKPNRLQQAKWAISNFVRHLKGDRIGLIAFAGSSFLQCPVTIDYAAFTMTLNDLYAGIIPKGGTAIAQALETAEESFDTESAADRVIILITDGEDHSGDPLKIAKKLNEKQIKLFSIGVGTASGELIPAADGRGYLKDEQGRVIKSTLNETLLEQLARETGGFYVRSAPGDFGLDRIYALGISNLQRDEQETRLAKIYKERTGYFIAAALLLLLAETLLRNPKIALLLLLFCIPNADAEEKFPAIEKYNQGHALYREGNFQGSEKLFGEAAAQTTDETLKQKALHNRGTALLASCTGDSQVAPDSQIAPLPATPEQQLEARLAATTQAIENLEEALQLNPAALSTKQNLERALALKERLEKQKQEEEKEEKKEKGKEDDKDSKEEKEKSDKSDQQEQQNQEDQKQEQEQQQEPEEQQSQPSQKPQQQAGEMSEEEAQQLLDAMKQNEKDQRQNLRPYLGQPIHVDKDW